MAHAIPHSAPTHDPLADLHARLQNAPAEHAEAILSAYEVLQGLHESGVLDLMRGAMGSRDKLLEIAVGAAGSPESSRMLRNLLLLSQMLGAIDPQVLRRFTQAVPQALIASAGEPASPGLWRLIKDFLWNREFRQGLAAVNTMLKVLGGSLAGGNKQVGSSPVIARPPC
ncbi:MAG: DUF1641 domain-containing protein [Pyrinomonadaceae bacterium]|nr:DUF1641 domain-containing protein [Phycisphaerales bacterium]